MHLCHSLLFFSSVLLYHPPTTPSLILFLPPTPPRFSSHLSSPSLISRLNALSTLPCNQSFSFSSLSCLTSLFSLIDSRNLFSSTQYYLTLSHLIQFYPVWHDMIRCDMILLPINSWELLCLPSPSPKQCRDHHHTRRTPPHTSHSRISLNFRVLQLKMIMMDSIECSTGHVTYCTYLGLKLVLVAFLRLCGIFFQILKPFTRTYVHLC